MNFKELKTGFPIYQLTRKDMKLTAGKVISVSVPHIDTKIGAATQLVVDIDAELEGTRRSFCMIADSDVAYPAGQVIATNREAIKREVDATRIQCEQALAQVDEQRKILERCKQLAGELDPSIREKQQTEERFNKLEGSIGELKSMFAKVMEKL